MQRITVILSSLLLSLMAGSLSALELGAVSVESGAGEPLSIRLEILEADDARLRDISVTMVAARGFGQPGSAGVSLLDDIRIATEAEAGNNYVVLTSTQPAPEPYLDFILEIRWPNGNLRSEHTVLLNPLALRGQAAAGTAPSVDDSGSLTVVYGDTLLGIAARVRPDGSVSLQQVMLAIQQLNPAAFRNGNINQMLRDQVLNIPVLDQIRSIEPQLAVNEVNRQNQQFADFQAIARDSSGESGGETGDGTADQTGGAVLDRRIAELESQLALEREQAQQAVAEREALQTELAALETQLADARETIRRQDEQLVRLQAELAEAAAAREAAAAQLAAGTASLPERGAGALDELISLLTDNRTALWVVLAVLILLPLVLLLRRRGRMEDDGAPDEEQEYADESGGGNTGESTGESTGEGEDEGEEEGEEEFAPDDDEEDDEEYEAGPGPREQGGGRSGLAPLDFLAGEGAGAGGDMDNEAAADEQTLLSGDHEVTTKLELAYAYRKMGDMDGAREILLEVIREGSTEQVREARELMTSIDQSAG